MMRTWPLIAIAVTGCAEAAEDAPGSATTQGVIFNAAADQFAGGFHPSSAPDGGFGGGNCVATRTPVIFVHGNTVNASFIARPSTSGVPSVYDTLKAAGYNDCELFGITYLSPIEQASEPLNYHTRTKAARIRDFIKDVKAYTGRSKVNILAHSMGVTVALHGITYGNLWGRIERVINVAGGLKGLSACLAVGYANPAFPTCGSQNIFDSNIFGFWPDGAAGAANPRTGTSLAVGFRREPERRPDVRFFTISGGSQDTKVGGDQCKFSAAASLRSQLDVNIDHLSTFTDTGAITRTMLESSCAGTGCCAGYAGTCVAL
jgi:triacylglycerol esterase/lipase EstA (alpha/beta hydrolase family)